LHRSAAGVLSSFCAARTEGRVWRGRNDEPVFLLVPRRVQINPGKLLFLVDLISAAARRCAVLSAAVSLFFARPSALPDSSDQHTCRHDPHLFPSCAVALWIARGGVSGSTGDVLSRAPGVSGVWRLFHLRRAVWFLL